MIDFGSAQAIQVSKNVKIKDRPNPRQKCKKEESSFGRGWYHSKNRSRGLASSRRDDLESLGYMLIYLIKGCLPWYKPHDDDSTSASDDARDCNQIKMETSIEELTSELPNEFAKYFRDVQELEMDDFTIYFTLKNRFRQLAKRLGFVADRSAFDWNSKKSEEANPGSDIGSVYEKSHVVVVNVSTTKIIRQPAGQKEASNQNLTTEADLKPPHPQPHAQPEIIQ